MTKSKLSEQQIIARLNEGEAGVSVADLCRKYQVLTATYYKFRSKYSGMNVSNLKCLKDLEAENQRLKAMCADARLDHKILKEVMEKKVPRPDRQKLIPEIKSEHRISLNRACRLMSINKTSYYHKPKKRAGDLEITQYLQGLANKIDKAKYILLHVM